MKKKTVNIQQSFNKSDSGLVTLVKSVATMFGVILPSVVSTNARTPQNYFGRKDGWTDGWMEKVIYMCPADTVGNGW